MQLGFANLNPQVQTLSSSWTSLFLPTPPSSASGAFKTPLWPRYVQTHSQKWALSEFIPELPFPPPVPVSPGLAAAAHPSFSGCPSVTRHRGTFPGWEASCCFPASDLGSLLYQDGVTDPAPPLQPGPVSTCSLLMAAPRYPARVPFRQMPSVVQARTPRIGFNSLSFSAQIHSLFWYNDSGISLFSSFTLVCHHPQTYRLLTPSTGSPELWSHFHSSAEHLAMSLSPTTL